MTNLPEIPESLKTKKIAIFYSFLKVRGGAEKLLLSLRNYYKADFFAGAVNEKYFNKTDTDSFSKDLFNANYKLEFLHKDSNIPLWYAIKRQLFFLFSPKIKDLKNYDIVIFSGNVSFVQRRLQKVIDPNKTKLVNYCNTPPRLFTDQYLETLRKVPTLFRPFFKLLAKLVRQEYKKDLQVMDLVIANSKNIIRRLEKYLNYNTKLFAYPPVDVNKYQYIQTGNFFLSHSRLEDLKRIPMIVEAFGKMPNKKLVICSTGPLKDWLINEIKTKNLTNINYLGIVSDEKLYELVGTCLAAIVIPKDEDFGLVQCELMSAGKPVIGVKEGGLLETVIDGETGILLPTSPKVEDLITAVENMTPELALSMKLKSIIQAQKFSEAEFFQKMNEILG